MFLDALPVMAGTRVLYQGMLGPELDKVLEPGQVLRGAQPSSHGGCTQSPTCALAEDGTASSLVYPWPMSGSQFTALFYLGLGEVPYGEDFIVQ